MFLAGSVIDTVLVCITFAVSMRPVLTFAAVTSRTRRCAILLQPRSHGGARPGAALCWRPAEAWRAGGGVARTG
jgi:hypothetical protein